MLPSEWFDQHPQDLEQYAKEQSRLAADIQAEYPHLHPLTVITMAGDRYSAERSTQMVEAGVPWQAALPFVGSFARIGWLVEHGTPEEVAAMLPAYWTGADPDDTDPRFWAAWHDAWVRNKKKVILDDPEKPLPSGRYLTIYRGQSRNDVPGVAWTLSLDVAERFAKGAGVRFGGIPSPVIYSAMVKRSNVMAYLTKRNEQEIIVNPFTLEEE